MLRRLVGNIGNEILKIRLDVKRMAAIRHFLVTQQDAQAAPFNHAHAGSLFGAMRWDGRKDVGAGHLCGDFRWPFLSKCSVRQAPTWGRAFSSVAVSTKRGRDECLVPPLVLGVFPTTVSPFNHLLWLPCVGVGAFGAPPFRETKRASGLV